jgi:hypothetical protein
MGRVRIVNIKVKFKPIIEGHLAWVAIIIIKDEGQVLNLD